MDVRKLRKIVELLHEFDIDDFKLKDEQSTVQITRKSGVIQTIESFSKNNNKLPSDTVQSNQNQEFEQPSFANRDQKNIIYDDLSNAGPYSDDKVIKSPMVGTYYSAASPDSDDFIKKGQKIDEGDVVCIIEAMKIMNRIEAERSGVVKEILVSNGDPVQFGQLLVVLE